MCVALFVLVAVDCVQVAVGLVAFQRARHSLRAGAPGHARYSNSHGELLVGGALVLAVPVLLGLLRVTSSDLAVGVALALEVVAFFVSRPAVRHFEAAYQARRPGVSPAS